MQNFLKKMTVVSVFLKMNDEVKKQGGREVCKVVGVGSTRHTCSPKQLHLRVVMSTLVCKSVLETLLLMQKKILNEKI